MEFGNAIESDHRIGPLHISVYTSILCLWLRQGCPEKVKISARIVMPLAKIASSNPYHRVIRQLNEWGYIRYNRSFDPKVPSEVLFD